MTGAEPEVRARRKHAHDPRAPRLDPPTVPQERFPGPIADAIVAARRYYESRHHSVPALLRRRRGRRSKLHGRDVQTYHVQRKRSDRTEAHVRLLIWAFSHCQLSNFHVGVWDAQARRRRPQRLEEIAAATALAPRTLDHAIADGVAAGFFYRHQPRQLNEDGETWEGEVALFKLTKAAFEAFGVGAHRIRLYRDQAEAKEHKARKEAAREKPAAAVATLINRMVDPVLADVRTQPPQPLPADRPAYNEFCWQIGKANPEWDTDRVQWAAIHRLYGPDGPPKR